MEDNIYQTPKSEELLNNQGYENSKRATTGQRFSNMLLDMLFFMIFSVIVGVIFGITGYGESLERVNDNLLGFAIMLTYYVPQEAIWGRTLGKLITRTKVVDLDGKDISFFKALGRTLCRFIPFEAFTFLGGGGRPHGIHDKLAKTKVITLKDN